MTVVIDDICVRAALPQDATNIARLWIQCTTEVAGLEPVYRPAVDHKQLAGALADELDASGIFAWVAMRHESLAGYVTCRFENGLPVFAARRYLYVIDLDVSPGFRGLGLSHLLMNQAETFARENGIDRVELAYVSKDPRAQQVWARHGFTPYFVHAFKALE